jgi:HEPN domain-containing protein
MKRKRRKSADLNVSTALYIADSYFLAAVRAGLDHRREKAESKQDYSGATCIAISSHAFAIEVYIKALIFLVDSKVYGSHDLRFLWKNLPLVIREWVSEAFEKNISEDNKEWSVSMFSNIKTTGVVFSESFTTGKNSAYGIITSHRLAYQIGRYAYEMPPPDELKCIPHNIPGLELVSGLLRLLAHHITNGIKNGEKEIKDCGSQIKGKKMTFQVEMPAGKFCIYPEEAQRIINEWEDLSK